MMRMKEGRYGTLDVITAHISYASFTEHQSQNYEEPIQEYALEIKKMMDIWPSPTLNPFMDKVNEYESDVGMECLKMYIKDHMTVVSRDKVDNHRDVVKLQVPFDLLMVNTIPIFDNESLTIEKATVQTLFYRHEIKGDG